MKLPFKNLQKFIYTKYNLILFLKYIKNFLLQAKNNFLSIFYFKKESYKKNCLLQMKAFVNNSSENSMYKNILIDAIFDNPSYWFRISLIRRALNLSKINELCVVGKWYNNRLKKDLNLLGISNIQNLNEFDPEKIKVSKITKKLLDGTKSENDILNWKLPFNFPADAAYDSILKHQRKNVVDIFSPDFPRLVYNGIKNLYAADNLIKSNKFDAVFISQICNFDQGGIAWAALRRNISTFAVTGHGGLNRFVKKTDLNTLFYNDDTPKVSHVKNLKISQKENLIKVGKKYINNRVTGQTNELGALYSYKINNQHFDKSEIYSKFKFNPKFPIVCVFAQNWFDYPHAFGMRNFRDFRDWINFTIKTISSVKKVNWLIKPHPCDAWYGGETINDIISNKDFKNIKICPEKISGVSILNLIDGGVTVHGTIGLELTSLNKQVLLADKGWYDHHNFCTSSHSVEDYKSKLKNMKWSKKISNSQLDSLYLFTGLLFCAPKSQANFFTGNDTEQTDLFPMILDIFKNKKSELDAEIKSIINWIKTSEPSFHLHKMTQSNKFCNFEIPLTSHYIDTLKKRKV